VICSRNIRQKPDGTPLTEVCRRRASSGHQGGQSAKPMDRLPARNNHRSSWKACGSFAESSKSRGFGKWARGHSIEQTFHPRLLEANAHALARYARSSGDGLVLSSNPKAFMDGDHTIERCGSDRRITSICFFFRTTLRQRVLRRNALKTQHGIPEGLPQKASTQQVAEATIRCLRAPFTRGARIVFSPAAQGMSKHQKSRRYHRLRTAPWQSASLRTRLAGLPLKNMGR